MSSWDARREALRGDWLSVAVVEGIGKFPRKVEEEVMRILIIICPNKHRCGERERKAEPEGEGSATLLRKFHNFTKSQNHPQIKGLWLLRGLDSLGSPILEFERREGEFETRIGRAR